MDYNTVFNRLNESLLASTLQIYFPLRTEQTTKNSSFLDVDLFDLKQAYDVPVDLSSQVKADLTFTKSVLEPSEDDEDFEEHLPIEFCESLIDEEEESVINEESINEELINEGDANSVPEDQGHLYKCCHCVFKGAISELREHYKTHQDNCTRADHWCVECKVSFQNEAIFKLHQIQEHVFYCSKCYRSFKTQRELLSHLSVHNPSKGYECPICKKVFPVRRYFVRHLDRHEKKKKGPEKVKELPKEQIFKCTECQKEFMKKESLIKHTKIHSRDSLKCSLCDFTCEKKVTLKMHVISHEGNRKYKCDHCDFSFKQIGHLKRHIARFNH